jgi:hypothetical protein
MAAFLSRTVDGRWRSAAAPPWAFWARTADDLPDECRLEPERGYWDGKDLG